MSPPPAHSTTLMLAALSVRAMSRTFSTPSLFSMMSRMSMSAPGRRPQTSDRSSYSRLLMPQ